MWVTRTRSAGRHEPPSALARRRAVTATAAVALFALGSGVAASLVSTEPPVAPAGASAAKTSTTRTSSTSTPSASPSASPSTRAVDVAVQRKAVTDAVEMCRLSNLRQENALSRGAVSMAMWDKHIEAMNLLVAGKISLDVAYAFWESSRIGAMQNVTSFRNADKAYVALAGSACTPLSAALTPVAGPSRVQALRQCHAAKPRGDVVLARARPAVVTWEHHIHDMEALRLGQISAAEASAKWRRDWKKGNAQLKQYDAAVARRGRTNCPLA